MAVCMNTSGSQSPTTCKKDLFESQIIESNNREKTFSSLNRIPLPRATSRFNLPPMSAPPIITTRFKFGVDHLFVERSTEECIASGIHIAGGSDHMPSKKLRAKSLSFLQPACHLIKQYQERITTSSCCLTVNTLTTCNGILKSYSNDQSNKALIFNTLPTWQPSTPYPRGDGVSIQFGIYVDVSQLSCGPHINAPSSPVIGIRNSPDRECSPGSICRICHDGAGALISPCLCAGTVALIHKDCLERWLTQINRSSCEICQYNYRVQRRPLPFYKVFSDSTNSKLRRSILTDLACFVGLTPLAIAAICLCLLGAIQVFQSMTTDHSGKLDPADAKAQEASRQWEAGWLIFLAVMLSIVYIIWFSCTYNSHMKTWALWRLASLQVKLLDIKRPCLDEVGSSDHVPYAPIRLMMEDATITPSDESTLNNHVAESLLRPQLPGSPTPSASPLNRTAQDVPNISSTLVNSGPLDELPHDIPGMSSTSANEERRASSGNGEVAEARVNGNYIAVLNHLLKR